VVVDLSCHFDRFNADLGVLLQDFVSAGGVVAFPSSESNCSTLQQFFNVQWKTSSYYRTTWGPCMKDNKTNINNSFGNGDLSGHVMKEYSAKAVSLNNVPPHERCFGVTDNSATQSLVPMMSGRDVSRNSNDDDDDDYDIVVAMHEYGKGVIAYFGDVNGEDQTLWLVASFVESRSPQCPIDCFSALTETEFSEALRLKEKGNDAFKNGQLDEAITCYDTALGKFGKVLGSNGVQRESHVAILSNLSLIHLKKKEYHHAESVASKALDIEWGHDKCSYRRAKARLHVSQSSPNGDLTRLRAAKKDILNMHPSEETRKLLLKVMAEIKRLEKKEQQQFGAGFGAALTGKI